jgi:glycerol-3-phosphate acyltransferase PlsY
MNLDAMDPQQLFAARIFWLEIGAVIVALSYLLGSILFGYIVARLHGMDIRKHGSGNIGATNVMRVIGKKAGYTVFALDLLKGLVAAVMGKYIAAHHFMLLSQSHPGFEGVNQAIYHSTYFVRLPEAIAAISAAIACIIGHNFPIWLGFKGGKGMATSLGGIFGMMPLTGLICFILWLIVFFATRYSSLASLVAAVALPVVTMVLLMMGVIHGWPYFYFAVAACLLAVWRHRANIVRLMNGTESRFSKKPKLAEAEGEEKPEGAEEAPKP